MERKLIFKILYSRLPYWIPLHWPCANIDVEFKGTRSHTKNISVQSKDDMTDFYILTKTSFTSHSVIIPNGVIAYIVSCHNPGINQ